MRIIINNKTIYADGYIANPNDLSIQFYREKSILDVIPPIKVSEDMLSDFGREIITGSDKIIDALNEIGCTSFTFSKEEIEQIKMDYWRNKMKTEEEIRQGFVQYKFKSNPNHFIVL